MKKLINHSIFLIRCKIPTHTKKESHRELFASHPMRPDISSCTKTSARSNAYVLVQGFMDDWDLVIERDLQGLKGGLVCGK